MGGGIPVFRHFTLQEDIADCGGLKLAHIVYEKRIGGGGTSESIVPGVTMQRPALLPAVRAGLVVSLS